MSQSEIAFCFLGNNGDLSSMNDNSGVYGTLSNSVSSSVYPQNEYQSMYSPNGFNEQAAYSHTNYPKHPQSSYGLLSSQSTGNVYGSGAYPSSSIKIPSNDIQSSSTSLNQYATANLPNGQNQSNYEANMSYAPYYPNSSTQRYYPQQQVTVNQSQNQIPLHQTISFNDFTTSFNGGLNKKCYYPSR
jgi:hypothetical protein